MCVCVCVFLCVYVRVCVYTHLLREYRITYIQKYLPRLKLSRSINSHEKFTTQNLELKKSKQPMKTIFRKTEAGKIHNLNHHLNLPIETKPEENMKSELL